MKTSDIKIGDEYAWQRRNYDWDAGDAERIKILSEEEWTSGPSWALNYHKGFKVQLLDRPGLVYLKVTAREIRTTWADFTERRARIDANNARSAEEEFNRNVATYIELLKLDKAIRKLDIFRESTSLPFFNEREMKAAEVAGWNVVGEYTHVVMDVKATYGRTYLRPRFQVSDRDANLLIAFTLRVSE